MKRKLLVTMQLPSVRDSVPFTSAASHEDSFRFGLLFDPPLVRHDNSLILPQNEALSILSEHSHDDFMSPRADCIGLTDELDFIGGLYESS